MQLAHLALLIARDLSVIALTLAVVACLAIGLGAALFDIQASTLPALERKPLKRVLVLHQLILLVMAATLLLAFVFYRPEWIPIDLAYPLIVAGLLLIAEVALVHERVEYIVLARRQDSLRRFHNASAQE